MIFNRRIGYGSKGGVGNALHKSIKNNEYSKKNCTNFFWSIHISLKFLYNTVREIIPVFKFIHYYEKYKYSGNHSVGINNVKK